MNGSTRKNVGGGGQFDPWKLIEPVVATVGLFLERTYGLALRARGFDVDDVCVDVVCRCHRYITRKYADQQELEQDFPDAAALSAFATTVARNAALDIIRRYPGGIPLNESMAAAPADEEAAGEWIYEYLPSLAEPRRQAIKLHHLDGHSYEVVAKKTGNKNPKEDAHRGIRDLCMHRALRAAEACRDELDSVIPGWLDQRVRLKADPVRVAEPKLDELSRNARALLLALESDLFCDPDSEEPKVRGRSSRRCLGRTEKALGQKLTRGLQALVEAGRLPKDLLEASHRLRNPLAEPICHLARCAAAQVPRQWQQKEPDERQLEEVSEDHLPALCLLYFCVCTMLPPGEQGEVDPDAAREAVGVLVSASREACAPPEDGGEEEACAAAQNLPENKPWTLSAHWCGEVRSGVEALDARLREVKAAGSRLPFHPSWFRTGTYEAHAGGRGTVTPEWCLLAAFWNVAEPLSSKMARAPAGLIANGLRMLPRVEAE